MRVIFILLSVILIENMVMSQVSIGTAASGITNQSIPVECDQNFTYSQMIYTANEINASGTITSLKFYKTGSNLANSSNWTVYLGHTTSTTFFANVSWLPVLGLTQVFSDSVVQSGNEVLVTLSTPFVYNGIDNLVVAIDENQAYSDGTGNGFYCSARTGNSAIVFDSNTTNPIPSSPPVTTNLRAAVANIEIGGLTQPCSPTYNTIVDVACDTYTSATGIVYTSTGVYQDTILNSSGCDSIITYDLVISYSTAATVYDTACGLYASPGGTVYTSSGTYYDTLINAAGCDSVITIHLTIANTFDTIMEYVCDSYTAPSGIVYYTSGTYLDIIPNSAGCDSNITINLVVGQSSTSALTVNACDTYISPSGQMIHNSGNYTDTIPNAIGCDSILFLTVTVSQTYNITTDIEGCEEFVSDAGVTYDVSGVYTESFTTAGGCDSTITYNISITNIDTTVTISGNVLSCNESGATTYQWIDCSNDSIIIPGADSASLEPTENGSYACIITKENCTNKTGCITISGLNTKEHTNDFFSIYPNPSSDKVNIHLEAQVSNTSIVVSDMTGKIIYSGYLLNSNQSISLDTFEPGMYLITIKNGLKRGQKALIIQ